MPFTMTCACTFQVVSTAACRLKAPHWVHDVVATWNQRRNKVVCPVGYILHMEKRPVQMQTTLTS